MSEFIEEFNSVVESFHCSIYDTAISHIIVRNEVCDFSKYLETTAEWPQFHEYAVHVQFVEFASLNFLNEFNNL